MNKKYLVITNAYPSEDNLYRNGFIHRRVKAYEKYNIDIEIFVLNPSYQKIETYEYQNIKVSRGNKEIFRVFLQQNNYIKGLIHFVSLDMIEVLRDTAPNMPLIIWIHGFEAESWHRRWFNFLQSRNQLQRIINMSKDYYPKQLDLMHWLYTTKELNIKFIHVSKWFKDHIAEPDARAKARNTYIIPNLIDEEIFNYKLKSPSDRLKILSIRPYASRKYANDQSVKAVLELSKRPFFKRLEFSFYGDGSLFDETISPIKHFKNVKIHKGFLKQEEIANLHKEYGIFLCPTRLDSQGVSMCEAMSSGLVPVTSNISAIPEFVEHRRNGLLASPEDWVSIANEIENLYFNPSLFSRLSQNASRDIVSKCGKNVVIKNEMELIIN